MNGGNRTERTFSTGPVARLEISNVRGSIAVKSWDQDIVQVIATVETDGSPDLVDLAVGGSGNRVTVKAEAVKNVRAWMREVFRSTVPSVSLEIRCPRTSDVAVKSAASRIEIKDLKGKVDVNQATGQVRIAELDGALRLNSVSGNISCSGLHGPASFKSVSRNLDIKASRVTSLSIQTVTGNVSVDTLAPGDDPVTLNTVSEKMTLLLDSTQGYTATLRTVSGTVQTDLPSRATENSRTTWKSELNGGGREIRMNSVSGSFELIAASSEGEMSDSPGDRPGESERIAVLQSLRDGDIDVDEALKLLRSDGSLGSSELEGRNP